MMMMMNYDVIHVKSRENKTCSLDLVNCINHIQQSLDREMILNGPDYLSGLFRLTPQLIQSKVSVEHKRPRRSTSPSQQCNPCHMTSHGHSQSLFDDSNSQESLHFTSPKIQNALNDKIPLCIVTPIDNMLSSSSSPTSSSSCVETSKFGLPLLHSTTSCTKHENSYNTDCFHSLTAKSKHRLGISQLAPSVLKARKDKLFVEYQTAIEQITCIDIPPEYNEKLLSLLK
ncbi:unnamed protein product [Schistosoma turkestanicum]|nr:unnamed protein product [Schistosoma turkestanicum]